MHGPIEQQAISLATRLRREGDRPKGAAASAAPYTGNAADKLGEEATVQQLIKAGLQELGR